MEFLSAWIQRHNGEFINSTGYVIWEGCKLFGLPIYFFEAGQVNSLPWDKTCFIHGGVSSMDKIFAKLKINPPTIDQFPPTELLSFYGRNIDLTTLGQWRNKHQKCFIKPQKLKQFPGHIFTDSVQDLSYTANFPDETPIVCSEIIDFVSEYRVFVHKNLIRGCHYYRGDFTKYPDFDIVIEAVLAWNKAPVAYAMDVGVTSSGQTLIVEINDAFALGHYGMASIPYTQLIMDRWKEILDEN